MRNTVRVFVGSCASGPWQASIPGIPGPMSPCWWRCAGAPGNGSDSVDYTVATLPDRLRIEFSKSCSRPGNDTDVDRVRGVTGRDQVPDP